MNVDCTPVLRSVKRYEWGGRKILVTVRNWAINRKATHLTLFTFWTSKPTSEFVATTTVATLKATHTAPSHEAASTAALTEGSLTATLPDSPTTTELRG